MIQNEIFGPVITVQPFSDEDEALRVGQRRRLRAGLERVDRRTTAARCACRARWTSAACGSTATSRWWPRCRTAASSSPGYGKDLSLYGARGLHAHQARDELHRAPGRVSEPPARDDVPDLEGLPDWVKSLGLPPEAAARSTATGGRSGSAADELELLPSTAPRARRGAGRRGAEQLEFEAVEELAPGREVARRASTRCGRPTGRGTSRRAAPRGPTSPTCRRALARAHARARPDLRAAGRARRRRRARRPAALALPAAGLRRRLLAGRVDARASRCSCATTTTRPRGSRGSST